MADEITIGKFLYKKIKLVQDLKVKTEIFRFENGTLK